jgi:hypothetical protein
MVLVVMVLGLILLAKVVLTKTISYLNPFPSEGILVKIKVKVILC